MAPKFCCPDEKEMDMRKRGSLGVLVIALSMSSFFAGCAVEQKCGLGCPGDAQITAKVEALFNQHPEVGTEVSVQTLDRVVYPQATCLRAR